MFVGRAAPLWISTKDFSGVQKVIGHLQKDIERVTGVIPTIVNGDIQEKTAAYVSGKINSVQFRTALKAAFGEKYNSVLPRINGSLPANKRI